MRRAIEAADLAPIRIRGGSFTFRTFHGPDNGPRDERRTVDRLITVTLPAISGEDHSIAPTMEVRL